MKPRFLMKGFHCTLMKAGRMQCRLDFVFLEQLTWTHAYPINKPFKNHTLPIHCPLMNHSWATHEPLMNSFHLATRCQRKLVFTSIHNLCMSRQWITHEKDFTSCPWRTLKKHWVFLSRWCGHVFSHVIFSEKYNAVKLQNMEARALAGPRTKPKPRCGP